MPNTALLATVILNGVSFSMLLFLLAAGLELMFGVMIIVNLAHDSFYMLGPISVSLLLKQQIVSCGCFRGHGGRRFSV